MTPDIRIQASFITHPKTKKMIRRIGYQGPFCLIALWTFAATSGRSDGYLSNMDEDDIEIAADWTGEAGQFLACALQLGFLEQTESGYQIHDWADHQPWVIGAKERSEKARKAAEARWKQSDEHAPSDAGGTKKDAPSIDKDATSIEKGEDDATSMQQALPQASPSNAPLPSSPNLSSPTDKENLSSKDIPPCPRKKIIDLYHEHCPLLPSVRIMTPAREKALTARWRQEEKFRSLKFWEEFFKYVSKSAFLNGDNDRGWSADFEWLVHAGNFAKVIEGKYHTKEAAA